MTIPTTVALIVAGVAVIFGLLGWALAVVAGRADRQAERLRRGR